MAVISNQKTALVLGASGLVGGSLVKILESDDSYASVEVFNRKTQNYSHPKVHEHIVDFNRPEDFSHLIKGDDLFVCIGTTIRKAGSIQKMEEIDRDLPVRFAQLAYANGTTSIAVVSSIGADAASRNYYLRIKGEMEDGIRQIPFNQIVITRPSMLLGHRKEFRMGELIGRVFIKTFGFLLVGAARKYRGIEGHTVALALIGLINSDRRDIIYPSDELQKFRK